MKINLPNCIVGAILIVLAIPLLSATSGRTEKTDVPDLEKLRGDDIPCLAPAASDEKAFGKKEYRWKKHVVTFAFLNGEGSAKLRERVTAEALKWNGHASIELRRIDDPQQSDVRVAFKALGHWSRIGNTATDVPKAAQTMNLQIFDDTSSREVRRVTLHEFGHALSLMHEHQNPQVTIQWREDAVLKYYSGPPNYWNEAQIQTNVLSHYTSTNTFNSGFDPDSIMLYPISKSLTYNFSSKQNTTISPKDLEALKLAYPLRRKD
jgi:5-methylcytosine-specific restriction endonuclease McrA